MLGTGCTCQVNRICLLHFTALTCLLLMLSLHHHGATSPGFWSDFLGEIYMHRVFETNYIPHCTSTHHLPSLSTHSRFLFGLASTLVDPGGFPGKVTQTFNPDTFESLVTLTTLGHHCYIYPTTTSSFTIEMKHGNTSRGSVMCQKYSSLSCYATSLISSWSSEFTCAPLPDG